MDRAEVPQGLAAFLDREIRAAQERLARSIGQRARWAQYHNKVDAALAQLFPSRPIWEHPSHEFHRQYRHRPPKPVRTE